ncbi:MAG: hypothetical protein F2839_03565 [Actinobacteria bacterium]|uniref:Unannotated protein n=1 Tax=freshwater metagenome TaxID=449393 RepID=A0A6J5Z7C3_9ZZZZ|nr:hypothetical protein [Actinomycetota bacterium]
MSSTIYALPAPIARKDTSLIRLPRRKTNTQEPLPFEWAATSGANALSRTAPTLSDEARQSFDALPTSRTDLPPADVWGKRLVQGMVEVINGVRPSSQLTRWVTPEVMGLIQSRVLTKNMPRYIVRSVHVSETDDGVAEVCSVFGTANRSFALAMRLEGLDGRWRATSLMWAV